MPHRPREDQYRYTSYRQDLVRFRALEDYSLKVILLRPIYMINRWHGGRPDKYTLYFRMLPSERDNYEVLLRWCFLDRDARFQKDRFPNHIHVSVNGVYMEISPGLRRPLNITSRCLLDNKLQITWKTFSDCSVTVELVRPKKHRNTELSTEEGKLFLKNFFLRQRRNSGPSVDEVEVSLICPLGKTRIKKPCRGSLCRHVQCFDRENFHMATEKRLRDDRKCPVCQRTAITLRFDTFMSVILKEVDADVDAVTFKQDLSWTPVREKNLDRSAIDLTVDTSLSSPCDSSQLNVANLTADLIDLTLQ